MVYAYGSGGHRCLGRAIHVPHLGLRKALKQTSRSLRGERFAAEKKTPNARNHCLRKFLFDEAHLCKRWRRDPCGSAGISKRAIKHFGICNQIAANAEESSSRDKAAIQIHHRQIE